MVTLKTQTTLIATQALVVYLAYGSWELTFFGNTIGFAACCALNGQAHMLWYTALAFYLATLSQSEHIAVALVCLHCLASAV